MVRLAVLDGVKIYIYPDEHPPSHIHAVSADFVALVGIDPPQILQGSLPLAVERRVLEWVHIHRDELLEAWVRVGNKRKPEKLS